MSVRIDVHPEMYLWAQARSGISDDVWAKRFPSFDSWLSGDASPTLKQLEDFANKTHTPFGYLLLDEPPVERVPIPDFRTIGDRPVDDQRVSANLLSVVYTCQARQEWYRDHQLLNGEAPLEFVGSLTTQTTIGDAAAAMRSTLGWDAETRGRLTSWSDALATLRDRAEAVGVLVAISGIVGTNTQRKLDPEEFRGFALADPYASLIFINGSDTKAAQVFTLAHELAHVWLGETGLSDLDGESIRDNSTERWCNAVAAEFLVPTDEFERVITSEPIDSQLQRLAEHFRVSTQVILGRFRELGQLSWDSYLAAIAVERNRIDDLSPPASTGGNFYNTRPVQVSKRFARALITSALEGQTPYTEAFRLLELKKASTFDGLAEKLGVK